MFPLKLTVLNTDYSTGYYNPHLEGNVPNVRVSGFGLLAWDFVAWGLGRSWAPGGFGCGLGFRV